MELPVSPLLFYVIIGLMMLGAFVIGFIFGSKKPKQTSSTMSKEVEQMAAKVLEVEQKLNAVQQLVEITDIEESNQVRFVNSTETDRDLLKSNKDKMVAASGKSDKRSTSFHIDDLQKITGIGPSLEEKLNDIGYYSYEQLSQLTDEEAESIASQLNLFSGRIHRDNWINQARELNDNRMQKSNA